jgi:hypothetical protein
MLMSSRSARAGIKFMATPLLMKRHFDECFTFETGMDVFLSQVGAQGQALNSLWPKRTTGVMAEQ